MNKNSWSGGLVRQFFSSRSHARPAWEAIETVTVAVYGFGLVVVLGRECIDCSIVGCGFDSSHVCAERVAVEVVRTRAGHQFLSRVVDGDSVLVVFGVLVALVGDVDESGSIDVEGESFDLYNLELFYISGISFSLVHSIATGESHPS
jgi:hypothetical protein